MASIRKPLNSTSTACRRKRKQGNQDSDYTENVSTATDDEFVERDDHGMAAVDSEEENQSSAQHSFQPHYDFTSLQLKPDASQRPLTVCPNGRIFLETFSALYKPAYDFVIAISDPVCRPQFIHEYQITAYSLYAAASLGLQTQDILNSLKRLSKVQLDKKLVQFIEEKTRTSGKVKLVLRKQRYYVESVFVEVLETLLLNEKIAAARIDHLKKPYDALANEEQKQELIRATATQQQQTETTSNFYYERQQQQLAEFERERQLTALKYKSRRALHQSQLLDEDEEIDDKTGFLVLKHRQQHKIALPGTTHQQIIDEKAAMGLNEIAAQDNEETAFEDVNQSAPTQVYSFEIDAEKVEEVRKTCNEINYPVIEEYDFRSAREHNTKQNELPISLKPHAQIREYQEKSLSKMFGNGRARSGIIVLPCGAGKTLVGITATATIKRSTLIFCTTGVAVDQWKRQVQYWTNLPSKYICVFTSSIKDRPTTDTLVLITTYNMVSFTGQRSAEADEIMSLITTQEWGLVLLDEVHVAPAKMFRRCVSITHSRCKLGLTATLVREDNLVDDLFYLIGPKLYEANWLDLQNAGYLATVSCVQIDCAMTPEFYAAYLTSKLHKQMLLYVMNPNKFRACEYLIRLHESRGDKVLVFSDNVFALRAYALALHKPLIYGATSDCERLQFLDHFQYDSNMNCLFISKVGDNSIDLPDVNVIIQISSHFSSRRQEAQRLGRILRPKSAAVGRFNAFFYTLVTRDTKEVIYATKRQRFLVEQGYAFKVVHSIPEMDTMDLMYSDKKSQYNLLCKVMAADVEEADVVEKDEADPYDRLEKAKRRKLTLDRKRGNLQALSGADDRAYNEFQQRRETQKQQQEKRHKLFKARAADRQLT